MHREKPRGIQAVLKSECGKTKKMAVQMKEK